jgi:flap endonuclease-1
MGIKYLNRFIRENCQRHKTCIRCIHLQELSGKKIAVDISIYLYKYSSLIENIYLMLSIFKYYGIIPIFIFDGKPPTEKKALIEQRKKGKLDAEKEYNALKTELHNPKNDLSPDDKDEIVASLDSLKKQFVYIKKDQIKKVKDLITSYGSVYYDAPGEADILCAQLVISGKVWACMSEDMDMFVYGTTRVLRYFSLMNHTAVVYYTENILAQLKMSQVDLMMICAILNNDYNMEQINSTMTIDLHKVVEMYKKYRIEHEITNDNDKTRITMLEWVFEKKYTTQSLESLKNNYEMFVLPPIQNEDKYEEILDKTCDDSCNYTKLQEILVDDGFVFI